MNPSKESTAELFPDQLEVITGEITSVVYHDDDSGWTVGNIKIKEGQRPVRVVGCFMSVRPGDHLKMTGRWSLDHKYGKQFKVDSYVHDMPTSIKGIESYLASSMVKGVGPMMAKRIVEKFGEKSINVIDTEIERLSEIEGIGLKRIETIRKAWAEQKGVQEVMLFLNTHGITPGYAAKIFRKYGNQAVDVLKENPYRLADDIIGIGFLVADRIGTELGFSPTHPLRLKSGIVYVLKDLVKFGHVFCPAGTLIIQAKETLQGETETLLDALDELCDEGVLIDDRGAIYLAEMYGYETGAAKRFLRFLDEKPSLTLKEKDLLAEIAKAETAAGIVLASSQRDAVVTTCMAKASVITGGPGTGKSTILRVISDVLTKAGMTVVACAPTGKAAKRMSESLGYDAKTIHRILEYSPRSSGFSRNEKNPIACDFLIVDEASMIDIILFFHLLKALPDQAHLVLVGDINQLPSVGPGLVLGNILGSRTVPVTYLTEIFRQAASSNIIVNAHKINRGEVPREGEFINDCLFMSRESPDEVVQYVVQAVRGVVASSDGTKGIRNCQVIAPMRKGPVGTEVLNDVMQQELNKNPVALEKNGRKFKIGDKIMVVKNNYDRDVFNGDQGEILSVDNEMKEMMVEFEGRGPVKYDFEDLDEIMLSYAITVHKSQVRNTNTQSLYAPCLITLCWQGIWSTRR
ncbi:MAG: ATP-dependent RecD-like DNA helicase [Syntrophus sp. SKADARSKE-3]|nr:ATP-dependent RecD-like DNA helicase [Syntrophus sp. SKADARSKE-3]